MNPFTRFLPWAVFGMAGVFLLLVASSPKDSAEEMHLEEFAQMPVQEGGRVKPLDTLARNNLLVISGRQTYTDEEGKTHPPIQWLLDVVSSSYQNSSASVKNDRPTTSEKQKLFRIEDPQALTVLGLSPRPGALYAFEEFEAKAPALLKMAVERIHPKHGQSAAPRSADVALVTLAMQVWTYDRFRLFDTPQRVFRIDNDRVLDLLGLEPRPGLRYSFAEITPRLYLLTDAARRSQDVPAGQRETFEAKVTEVGDRIKLYQQLADYQGLRLLPPASSNDPNWRTLDEVEREQKLTGKPNLSAHALELVLQAYAKGDARTFNQALDAYRKLVADQLPPDVEKVPFEAFFNHFAPFYWSAGLYVVVFLLALTGFLFSCTTGMRDWAGPLQRSAFWLAVLTLVVHTWALIARMYIQDRWFVFVTNLYSSAVFIGWGCVVLGLILEVIFRIGIGNLVAGVCGFLTLIIAHHLAAGGDTLEMMQAVLDTNFWLATHVTCVTLGYTATFFAGFLGIAYVLIGVFSRALTRDLMKTLTQMIYGVVCFATFLSFTGTVLGGIWADQSWGRFWGWDPKENGALIIVLWNALVLHARWGGMVKQRGLATLAVGGNIVTAWSWFGVNMLGVGLHSYGFMSGAVFWLLTAIAIHLSIIGLGLMPLHSWRSFAPAAMEEQRPKRRRDGLVKAEA